MLKTINMKAMCLNCVFEYDEEVGFPPLDIEPNTKWEDVSDDFVCPICGSGKDQFVKGV